MGLDNGIVVKFNQNKYINIPIVFPQNCEMCWFSDEGIHFEMIYWRKWWGPHNDTVHYLASKYQTLFDAYHFTLDANDLEEIINILKKWDDKDYWNNERASPIWEYEKFNIAEQILIDIEVLRKVINFMRSQQYQEIKDTMEIYFYDSY